MIYSTYKYIFPPRPENKISIISLSKFDNNTYLGQPKLNGSCMEVYTDGKQVIVMNRHKEILNHKIDLNELKKLHRGNGWMLLCGEYMNKNQKDENNNYWNIKFVIFDILIFNSEYLLKTTFEERYELLVKLYPDNIVKKYIHQISPNCFRVESIFCNFTEVYNDITQYEMYEGLVLKYKLGKLENGSTKNNNTKTQLKCRKSTKNYSF